MRRTLKSSETCAIAQVKLYQGFYEVDSYQLQWALADTDEGLICDKRHGDLMQALFIFRTP